MANTIAVPSALTTTGQSEKWRRLRAQQRAVVQRRVPTGMMVRLRSERKARCLYKGLKTKTAYTLAFAKYLTWLKQRIHWKVGMVTEAVEMQSQSLQKLVSC